MATLTYAPGADWSPRQVSRYLDSTVKAAARQGVKIAYEWVLETTRAGVPHYHVLWWVPKGFRIAKPDESGHWPYGHSRVELARKPVGYLVKYATKGSDDVPVPRGCRLFGTGGDRGAAFARHRAVLPMWLDKAASPGSRVRRVPFVGYLELETGAIHQSPFVVAFEVRPGGVTVIVRRVGKDGQQ